MAPVRYSRGLRPDQNTTQPPEILAPDKTFDRIVIDQQDQRARAPVTGRSSLLTGRACQTSENQPASPALPGQRMLILSVNLTRRLSVKPIQRAITPYVSAPAANMQAI